MRTTSCSSLALEGLSQISLQRPIQSMHHTIPVQLSALSAIIRSFCLGWRALGHHDYRFTAKASFAQTSTFTSFLSITVSFHSFEPKKMALVPHDKLIAILLANEAYTLPPALLKHVMAGTLYTNTLEAVAAQLDPAWFIDHLPQLPKHGELQFWLALGSTAVASFQQTNFQQLPPQKVPGSTNANLGNWQASSSFAKRRRSASGLGQLAERQSF